MNEKFKHLKIGSKIKHKKHEEVLTVISIVKCRNGYTIETDKFGLDRLGNFEPVKL